MLNIAKLTNGNFYFIENIQLLQDYFIDAIGTLISVIGINSKLHCRIPNKDKNCPSAKIVKHHGDCWNCDEKEKESYSIELKQLMGGFTKNIILDLEIVLPLEL